MRVQLEYRKIEMILNKLLKLAVFVLAVIFIMSADAQTNTMQSLNQKQQAIIRIAALTGKGDLEKLKNELDAGLEAGLSVNEIKEIVVHVYAYAGFPRSIRGLQTFMTVVDERKAKGMIDVVGAEAPPIQDERSKYDRGKSILDTLLGTPQTGPLTGYSAFAPIIEVFLKEHLFSDIFERDVLTYVERELVTISVLASIGGVEPMLQSHLRICLNMGLTAEELGQFVGVIKTTIGEEKANSAQSVLDGVLRNS